MNEKLLKSCLMAILFFAVCSRTESQELLDGVVAIVGDEVVLKSEIQNNAQYWAFQMGINPASQIKEFEKVKRDILQNLINDKVLLVKAKEDTIAVEDQKVENELENRIQNLIRQVGSVEKLEAQFGAPIKKIKRDNREEVKKMMIIRELESKKFKGIQVTRNEVQAFYATVKDSLPTKKPMVKLRHILFQIKPGEASKKRAFERIHSIRERLKNGEPFETLASQYSDDSGTSSRGGNLGFVERGTLFPSFEEIAFQLNPGQVSDPVETPLGFHLIKMEEKRGDQALLKHILIKMEKSENDEDETRQRLLDVRNRIFAGESFQSIAAIVNEDSSSRQSGGDLGWLPLEDLQIETFKTAIDSLDKGGLSMPFKTQYGYHLVYVEDKQSARKYTLEQDYDEFKGKAYEQKMQKLRDQWTRELKKGIYVEIKEDVL
jgi:peptidyl-prolyl cis-trans isomerase SurA